MRADGFRLLHSGICCARYLKTLAEQQHEFLMLVASGHTADQRCRQTGKDMPFKKKNGWFERFVNLNDPKQAEFKDEKTDIKKKLI